MSVDKIANHVSGGGGAKSKIGSLSNLVKMMNDVNNSGAPTSAALPPPQPKGYTPGSAFASVPGQAVPPMPPALAAVQSMHAPAPAPARAQAAAAPHVAPAPVAAPEPVVKPSSKKRPKEEKKKKHKKEPEPEPESDSGSASESGGEESGDESGSDSGSESSEPEETPKKPSKKESSKKPKEAEKPKEADKPKKTAHKSPKKAKSDEKHPEAEPTPKPAPTPAPAPVKKRTLADCKGSTDIATLSAWFARRMPMTPANILAMDATDKSMQGRYVNFHNDGFAPLWRMDMSDEARAEREAARHKAIGDDAKEKEQSKIVGKYLAELYPNFLRHIDIWYSVATDAIALASDLRMDELIKNGDEICTDPDPHENVRLYLSKGILRQAMNLKPRRRGKGRSYFTRTILNLATIGPEAGTTKECPKWIPDTLWYNDSVRGDGARDPNNDALELVDDEPEPVKAAPAAPVDVVPPQKTNGSKRRKEDHEEAVAPSKEKHKAKSAKTMSEELIKTTLSVIPQIDAKDALVVLSRELLTIRVGQEAMMKEIMMLRALVQSQK